MADELHSPDFVCHFVVGPEWRGLEGIKGEVKRHRTSFPDWHERVDDIVAEGDRVVIRFTSTGTHRGEFAGIAPTGRKVSIQEVAIFRVVGGKIVEQWGMPDIHGLMEQLRAPQCRQAANSVNEMPNLEPCAAANPAIALWLKSTRPAGRGAELGSSA